MHVNVMMCKVWYHMGCISPACRASLDNAALPFHHPDGVEVSGVLQIILPPHWPPAATAALSLRCAGRLAAVLGSQLKRLSDGLLHCDAIAHTSACFEFLKLGFNLAARVQSWP